MHAVKITGPYIIINSKTLINLCSNDYLGIKQLKISNKQNQSSSRLIAGNDKSFKIFEDKLARHKSQESSLIFPTGYMTNLGVITTLINKQDFVLSDELNHASLIEACKMSGAKLSIFKHNNMDDLSNKIKQSAKRKFIITEGVFSMDGDLAPLPDLLKLCQTYDATLVVDDAHGTGVMGANGRGTIEYFGLDPKDTIQIGTLSKAIGTSGGYVAGAVSLKNYLINVSKAFIFTTAQPPAIAAAASTAIEIIKNEPIYRHRLWENRDFLCSELKKIGFQLTNTQSPILPIIVKSPEKALQMSQALYKAGIYIPAIRPPTVPKESSRLRITVSSGHSKEQLQYAIEIIKSSGEELLLI